ncbi:MAG TPA: hypothetical protein VOB72_17670 [Candidatus Dormibacteraeota bacterium]|nr:hypothetical protein [Candidatus Dormibacteraeota bacterium]
MSSPEDSTRFIVLAARPGEHDPTELHLLVNHVPRREELRWRQHGPIYLAERDGFVSQLYYEGPGDGFYGAVFHLTMEDGSRRELIGPFSGGAHTVNEARPELAAVSVTLSEGPTFEVPYLGKHPGVITAEKLADIHRQFPQLAEQQHQAIAARDEHERQRAAEREARWADPPVGTHEDIASIRAHLDALIEREFDAVIERELGPEAER